MISLTALALSLALDPAACSDDEVSRGVERQRHAFNEAIREGELGPIESILTEDVVLVAGTWSDRFIGRDRQLAIWREEFVRGEERLVYVRTPACIVPSTITTMAMEYGQWRGEDPQGNFAAGRYTAKWRFMDGEWRLEAELFMTEQCGGTACPAETASGD